MNLPLFSDLVAEEHTSVESKVEEWKKQTNIRRPKVFGLGFTASRILEKSLNKNLRDN